MRPCTFQKSGLAKDYYYVKGDSDSDDEVMASVVLSGNGDGATQVTSSTRRLRGTRPATTPMRRSSLFALYQSEAAERTSSAG